MHWRSPFSVQIDLGGGGKAFGQVVFPFEAPWNGRREIVLPGCVIACRRYRSGVAITVTNMRDRSCSGRSRESLIPPPSKAGSSSCQRPAGIPRVGPRR